MKPKEKSRTRNGLAAALRQVKAGRPDEAVRLLLRAQGERLAREMPKCGRAAPARLARDLFRDGLAVAISRLKEDRREVFRESAA